MAFPTDQSRCPISCLCLQGHSTTTRTRSLVAGLLPRGQLHHLNAPQFQVSGQHDFALPKRIGGEWVRATVLRSPSWQGTLLKTAQNKAQRAVVVLPEPEVGFSQPSARIGHNPGTDRRRGVRGEIRRDELVVKTTQRGKSWQSPEEK